MEKEETVCVCVCVCVHTQWDISHKNEWNNAICNSMNEPRDYHSNWSKSDKDS